MRVLDGEEVAVRLAGGRRVREPVDGEPPEHSLDALPARLLTSTSSAPSSRTQCHARKEKIRDSDDLKVIRRLNCSITLVVR